MSLGRVNVAMFLCAAWIFLCFLHGTIRWIHKMRCRRVLPVHSVNLPVSVFGGEWLPMLLFCIGCFLLPVLVQRTCLRFFDQQLPTRRAERVLLLNFLGQLSVFPLLYKLVRKRAYNARAYSFLQSMRMGFNSYCELLPLLLLVVCIWQCCLQYLGKFYPSIAPTVQPIVGLLLDNQLPVRSLVLAFICITLLAPICEEIIFRGLILNFLVSKTNYATALLGSSMLFAALHCHFYSLPPLFCIGMWLGHVYYKSGDIRVNIVVHALFNGMNLLCLLFFLK